MVKRLFLLCCLLMPLGLMGQYEPNQLTPFQPYQQPPYPALAGLSVNIATGTAYINGTATQTIAAQRFTLSANANNYVYLNTTTGVIVLTTSGFPPSVYPIAVATTNATLVTTLADVRPYVFGGGGGGGGGA